VTPTLSCPLCGGADAFLHHTDRRGAYHRCAACALIYLDPAGWLSLDEEIARYRLHQNFDDDPRYQEFLNRLAAPVLERVPSGSRGLDYGCGPSTALAQILTRGGLPTVSYDPAFRADESVLNTKYDFVVCSEVLEHVHQPLVLLQRFASLVTPGGMVAVMTGFADQARPFGEWRYARDPTHVCFYSTPTMHWIAEVMGWRLELPAPNVALFATGSAG
jgi:SAM-dependent methyltransferase